MIESVKDSVFVAPAVGFPYAYLHEGEKYGLHLSPNARRGLEEEMRDHGAEHAGVAPSTACPRSSRAATTDWCARRWAATPDLELFVTLFGFSPAESLVAATNHGGAMMGLGRRARPARAGWLADLIVVDGDPLDDIAVLQDRDRINLVMKDGQIYRNDLVATAAPMRLVTFDLSGRIALVTGSSRGIGSLAEHSEGRSGARSSTARDELALDRRRPQALRPKA